MERMKSYRGGKHYRERAEECRVIAEVLRTAELREQMGQSGKTRAEAHFDWNRKIDQILEVYRAAMARRAERGGRRRA